MAGRKPWQIGHVYVFACALCAGRMSHHRVALATAQGYDVNAVSR
jgi:hypothetical protein